MAFLKQLNLILVYPLIAVLWAYQRTISPDHGIFRSAFPHGYCKFYPTCSVYAVAVLRKQGLAGIPKIFIRIGSCNPLSSGGIDLPYQNYSNTNK